MISPPKPYIPILLITLGIFLSACIKEKQVILDIDFSVNIATPGEKFPEVKKLTQAQREVYEIYRRPDFIHLWWTRDGRIHRYLEVDRRLRNRETFRRVKRSWIYLEKGIDYIFDTPEKYREVPLSDQLLTVCRYGDPEDVKRMSDSKISLKETWHYYGIGLILKFENGKLVSQQRHPPMGNFIKR